MQNTGSCSLCCARPLFHYLLSSAFFLLTLPVVTAQSEGGSVMESNGKLYVVVAVVVTIFIGIVIYLFSLDRRLKELERDLDDD